MMNEDLLLPPVTRPFSWLGSRLPHPGSAVFAAMLNISLRRDLPPDAYALLTGRRVEIALLDWGMRFRFSVGAGRFKPLLRSAINDLSINCLCIAT